MRIGLEGAAGVLGGLVRDRLVGLGVDVHPFDRRSSRAPEGLRAAILAGPPASQLPVAAVPTIAPGIAPAADLAGVTVPAGGWFGGLGTLLAAVVAEEAVDPRELHVAYGLPGMRGTYRRVSPTLRSALLDAATRDASARVGGATVEERLGEGRRLAWFPAPVGPAHAVAVGGHEQAVPLGVDTVRTWVAAGSLVAEWLQAVGRMDTGRGVGALLARRAVAGGRTEHATADLRWAVVVEVRDAGGGVIRAWANGTDPVAATADMLALGARRLGSLDDASTVAGTVLDLGSAQSQLDDLADLSTLRWSLSRPEPAGR